MQNINTQVQDNNENDEDDEDENDNNDFVLNFSAKDMNKKKTKKKIIKKKFKTKSAKNSHETQTNELSDILINSTNIINQTTPTDNETTIEPSKSILEYPTLDPKTLFNSFVELKISKKPLKDWNEENIPEQDFKIKGPIKSKIKKIRDNFRKLSKLCGTYGNCSTNPIGTSVWHNCMMHACMTNKTDGVVFKAHKLIGTGG